MGKRDGLDSGIRMIKDSKRDVELWIWLGLPRSFPIAKDFPPIYFFSLPGIQLMVSKRGVNNGGFVSKSGGKIARLKK